ncbi:arginyl-tRNA--protein transferase 2 isoform X2 [Cryptomeria japonica]|uniref:arginyl-tRNA--protein transferase 2 isoform X2 n=1 Tax=Cryptomeria japonica TaxID=3369 RepID=UPI0025AC14A7|nr:arginyl-tRNA--protein transferase 2 isoform X2 [Cryptomeria japonica]
MSRKMSRRADLGSSSGNGSNNNKRGQSIVEDCGVHRTTCGYCKSNARNSIAHGLLADSISVDDYQDLLDRGWRRSGVFLYKPEMERTCCPPYTIRLKVDSFVPSKEQTRVYRRMQRFLDGSYDGPRTVGDMQKESAITPGRLCSSTINMFAKAEMQGTSVSPKALSDAQNSKTSEIDEEAIYISRKIDDVVNACVESEELPADVNFPKAAVKKVTVQRKKKLQETFKDLKYSSSISFQIAAILNNMKLPEKLKSASEVLEHGQGQQERSREVSAIVVAEKLAFKLETFGGLPGFLLQACNGYLNFFSSDGMQDLGQSFSRNTSAVKPCPVLLSSKIKVDEKRAVFCDDNQSSEKHERQRLEIRFNRSSFDPQEFALYKKYQIKVHNDRPQDVEESSYKRFLVDTPLVYVPPTNDNTVPTCGLGSFHQQYLIDGQLVAVGVVDILPKCLSSKYLFWDPDFAFLSLGKISALEEIKWVQEAQKQCPSLQYYYLGYYIHSCPKMRYKAAYNPSELLCPVRYQWIPFQIAKPLLDGKLYVCLSDYPNAESILSQDHDGQDLSGQDDHEMEDGLEMYDGELLEIPNSDSSDDSIGIEYGIANSDGDLAAEDISGVLIQIKGLQFRFQTFGLMDRGTPDSLVGHLRKYVKVVGTELSKRMAYCLA